MDEAPRSRLMIVFRLGRLPWPLQRCNRSVVRWLATQRGAADVLSSGAVDVTRFKKLFRTTYCTSGGILRREHCPLGNKH